MTNTASKTQITKARLKEWSACKGGYLWFIEKFAGGAEFATVYKALIQDKRVSDADWLVGKALDGAETADQVKQIAIISGADAYAIAEAVANGAEAATTGYRANVATTGDWSNAATTGYRANAATTGYRANAATTGYQANAATTGDRANAATTGYQANAATTGDRANAATTGDCSNAATTGDCSNAATTGYQANAATMGEGAIAAALGNKARAKAGIGGAIVLAHRSDDGALLGVVAAMVGGDIKPDTWYVLDKSGVLKVDADQ
jgi:hypothetical protein